MIEMNKRAKVKEKIKDKIVDWIVAIAADQLIITKPPDESAMADLIVEKRGEYYDEAKIYLQIRECEKRPGEKVYKAEVNKEEFEPNENLYLLFLYFDIVTQDIVNIWLIPTIIFLKMAKSLISNGKKVLLFEAPIDIRIKNKYSKFLVDKNNLARVLKRTINEATD